MNLPMKILVWAGGLALLASTAIDTLAVVSRNFGSPVSGSIELMQAVVLVVASTALVIATVEQTHARIRILVDRLSGRWRDLAERFGDALTLIFLLALLAGSLWLSIDLWDMREQSEIHHVPWRVLRMIANACLVLASAYLAIRIVGKPGK